MEQVTEERKTAMYWQFFIEATPFRGTIGVRYASRTGGGNPALQPRKLLKTGEFRLPGY
jgi:hypothetical protein